MTWKRSLLALLVVVSGVSTPVAAQDFITGRVQKNEVTRVGRPAVSKPGGVKSLSRDDPKKGSYSDKSFELDVGDFQLGGKQQGFPENLDTPRPARKSAGLIGADEDSKELVIAWEAWHKRVSGIIYHRWVANGFVPGEAKVTINISRDGDLDWSIGPVSQPPFVDYEPGYEEAFRETVDCTLRPLKHRQALAFPSKSLRKNVQMDTRFSAQMDAGPSGYSWKKGDYERVPGGGD